MITDEGIRQKLTSNLSASHIDLTIEGVGCDGGAKLQLTVVSDDFVGKPLIKRHRMVNEIFSEELKSNQIHAISIKAYTAAQYESKK